jgi:hypothetical protein
MGEITIRHAQDRGASASRRVRLDVVALHLGPSFLPATRRAAGATRSSSLSEPPRVFVKMKRYLHQLFVGTPAQGLLMSSSFGIGRSFTCV